MISGFTSAVALTIVATQLGPHLGLKLHKEGFLPTVEGIIEHIYDCRQWDMILSAICISILLFMKVKSVFRLSYLVKIFHNVVLCPVET